MIVLTVLVGLLVVAMAINTAMVIALRKNHEARSDRLTSALLEVRGETRAADIVQPKTKVLTAVPPHERPRQVGLSPR